jgi:putative flippase GtrA
VVSSDRYHGLRESLAARVTAHPAWTRLTRTALSTRITKYALGSVVAFIASNVAFALFYVGGASTTACSVAGFLAGAIPNWVLNRRWAWQVQGRPPARQIIGYIGVSIAVLVTVILFVAKFAIYEYWVFSERSRVRAALRSLRQVPKTARANRIP